MTISTGISAENSKSGVVPPVRRRDEAMAPAGAPLSGYDRARLRQSPILAPLAPAAFEEILPAARILVAARDSRVFGQGDPAHHLHILLEGRVALIGRAADHRSCILTLLGPEEGLLDPAPLTGTPHLVAARTLEASRIACLPADVVNRILDLEPGLARGAVLALARHWRLFLRHLADQKLRSAPQRLASYLAEGAAAAESGAPIRVILGEDRRTLASHLGMTPENLSRVIAQLRQLGVRFNGRIVTIPDLEALRRFGCVTDGI